MLYAHYSHRAERLAASLAAVMRETDHAPPPCQGEIVVVHHAGMGRWLELEVARRNGIAAHLERRFPAELAWQLLGAVLPGVPRDNAFSPRRLAWVLFALLDEVRRRPGFGVVDRYLDGGDDFRRWSLARRLAGVFDQYLVYRPDWIRQWEDGDRSGDWQAALWRALVARLGNRHWANLAGEYLEHLAGSSRSFPALPPRVHLFGIPSLSPAYLHMLGATARQVDVHLYWFNPCREYWAEILTEREADEDDPHAERGNTLLANWGRQGRETLDLLQELEPIEHEDFPDGGRATLLACVQDDILRLVDRGEAEVAWPADDDDSIAIHACHGPMREIEVLHDALLSRFAADPGLSPDQVLVMTPDIERYAPMIEAVFSTAPAHLRIPYTIADRGARHAPLVAAFLHLLEAGETRAGAEWVIGLAQAPAVAAAFGLDEQALATIRQWVAGTGIRWGFDGDHRQRLDLGNTPEHSWRAGLDRLLLGHAMPVDASFAGVRAWPGVAAGDGMVLGGLARFLDSLEQAAATLSRPRDMASWSRTLLALVDRFLQPGREEEAAVQALRDAVMSACAEAAPALGEQVVSIDVVRAALTAALEGTGGAAGFLRGAVTFCSLVPMRSIPFRLIALVGMNDDAFPRLGVPTSLDRMATQPRRGDRSSREDDRYLFLEVLLSARESLYLSYVGQDIRDGSERPPSVVISDLVDYVGQGLVDRGDDREARRRRLFERLCTVHPLQPWHRDYFTADARLPGHLPYLAEAATAAAAPRPLPPFFDTALDATEVDTGLDELVSFYNNPARHLLRHRLGLWLDEYDEALAEREPFAIDRDAGEAIRAAWQEAARHDLDVDACETRLRQAGLLPHGLPGRLALEREIETFEPLRLAVMEAESAPLLPPCSIDLAIDGHRLAARFDAIRENGLCHVRLRSWQARDRNVLLLWHLAGCAAGVLPGPSRLLTLNGGCSLDPLDADTAVELLAGFLRGFAEGGRQPLPFFPRAAWQWFDHREGSDPLAKARLTWEGSRFHRGERENPYYQKVYGDTNPVDEQFVSWVEQLLLPPAAHLALSLHA